MLVCLARSARSHAAFTKTEHIGISVLAETQADIALRFADSSSDKFVSDIQVSDYHNVPVVEGALAHLYSRVDQCLAKGDHTILIAEVERAWSGQERPLLYWNRNFRAVASLE